MAKKRQSDFIDFKGLLRQYLAKWYWFVISAIVCVALAFAYNKLHTSEYQIRANVLISQQDDAMATAMGGLGELFGSNGYVEDEIFIISSHSVYSDVVRTLRSNIKHYVKLKPIGYDFVYRKYPVDVIMAPGVADTLSKTLVFKIKVNKNNQADITTLIAGKKFSKVRKVSLPHTVATPYGDYTVAATLDYPQGKSVKTNITVMGYGRAAESLDLDVRNEIASKRSNVISMSIISTSPEYGENVLNEIIAKYNDKGIESKNNQGRLTEDFLNERITILANDLARAEEEIQGYKQSHNIIDVASEARYQTEKRGRLEQALLEAETESQSIHIINDFLANNATRLDLVPLNVENEGLQTAIREYNALIVRRMELAASTSDDNVELRRMDTRIDLQRDNLRQSVSRAAEAAQSAIAQIRSEMGEAQSRLGDIPREEREYYDMRRQQEVKSQLYFFLLRRSEENAMLLANAVPKGQIIDEAYTRSEPLGMKPRMLLMIAFIFGLCIPPVLIYCRKLFYNRFETRADVERITDVPILGEMCIDKDGRDLVVSAHDTSSATELFRLMRTNLLFILSDPSDKVVLMTSSSSGEGKSFISINLAASLALLNKRVLLVGMDIRNPQLANYLHLQPGKGLTQYLSSDKVSLDDIIVNLDSVPGMSVIPAGPVPPNPAELLLSDKVDALFAELRARYDYIIVDTAPIGLVSDTFTLDRIADAAIYVCRANYTSLSDFNLVNEIYEDKRLKKLSIVINGTAAKQSYGYGSKKDKR